MTFITHGFRVSMISDVRERVRDLGSPLRFMLRRSALVEGVNIRVLHWTCLQCTEKIYMHQYVNPCLSKNPKYIFYTIKNSLTLPYKIRLLFSTTSNPSYHWLIKYTQTAYFLFLKEWIRFGRKDFGRTFSLHDLITNIQVLFIFCLRKKEIFTADTQNPELCVSSIIFVDYKHCERKYT